MRKKIGNPYADMPEDKDSLGHEYKDAIGNADVKKSFLENNITKVLIKTFKAQREDLINQLINLNPSDISTAGVIRGSIDELDIVLLLLMPN